MGGSIWSSFTGSNMGNIAGSYLTGVINSNLGWQYNFYINGSLAILVAIAWHFVIYFLCLEKKVPL